MYCVFLNENMSTNVDRRELMDVRANGLVSFFVFEAPISISVKQG